MSARTFRLLWLRVSDPRAKTYFSPSPGARACVYDTPRDRCDMIDGGGGGGRDDGDGGGRRRWATR